MYKILPILLFASLLAEEKSAPLKPGSKSVSVSTEWGVQTGTQRFIQSDSLDFAWAEKQLDLWIIKCTKKLSNIIDIEKFVINFETEVYDVMSMDTTSYKDFKDIKFEEMEKNYPPKNRKRLSVQFMAHRYMKLAIIKIIVEANVDKSIELDNDYRKAILGIINNVFYFADLDVDDIIFNSVDISKLKHNNNKISLNRDDIYDDSWAVIIGIDKYENLSNLDYAVADAEAVKDMLVSKFDYKEENVKLLLNEDANRTNIVKVISDVSLKAGENDRILVFYAGHGETMPLPDGGEMGYLVPIDGNQDNLFASAIPMDDLKRLSNMSKAKHMLFLVDACYGGLAAVGSRGLEPAKTPNYIEKITNIKSRQIITAGGKDEKVFEKSEWGHSAYTKNLLSALEDGLADSNGDGYITADELGDYLSEKVSIDSENLQTPQSRRLTSHEGEFIFIANDMQINVINTVERNEEHPKKNDEVLLNNETHDEGINIFGLGLFSGSDKKIINEKVKGGLLVSIFGNAKLNLVEAKLNQDKNIINIIVLFGGCTILVPSEMYVDTQVLPIFGSFKNRNDYIIEDSNQTNKKLIVRGVAIFGGGSVRNEKWYDNMGNWQ